jgi:hypothetical protein
VKLKHRRTGIRRKYKRLAAAVAGAAIMSSAMLPGIPAARVHAADPEAAAPITAVQPGTPVNTAADPVQTVTANAATYGFNAASGGFTLSSQTGGNAVVRVRSGGQSYNVDLVKQGDNWVVKAVRGIGDASHPATYVPAGMFPLAASPAAVPAGITILPTNLPGAQQMLFQTNNFDSWRWSDTSYPQDMAFGLLVRDPRPDGSANGTANDAFNPINNVDFGRQFVVYAHLGTTAAQGYGIGIASVTQSGNDLTITVRAQTPQPDAAATPTKTDDFVPLDRAGLNFANPIQVNFVDPAGTSLFSYTLNPS